MTYVPIVPKCTCSFIVALSYLVIQVLSDQYLIVNPIRNNILPTCLRNYGSSYIGTGIIPNPWTMIPNPYYPINLPHTFPNTSGLVAYLFPNIISIGITMTGGS
jgi:hypothetical protein